MRLFSFLGKERLIEGVIESSVENALSMSLCILQGIDTHSVVMLNSLRYQRVYQTGKFLRGRRHIDLSLLITEPSLW